MRSVEPETNPLGPKKTVLVIATVIGCIGILWPKVFHPMLSGGSGGPSSDPILPPGLLKDRGPGCCGVVLDTEVYMNSSLAGDAKRFRESIHFLVKDQSIRQERPLHMRPDPVMHPAMRERGFPSGPTHTRTVVEGRPGPIPGMRPPMGGGAFQQAPPKGNSMGLIMPLYTLGIIAFFVYTIMKIVCKKAPPVQDQAYTNAAVNSAQQKKALVEPVPEKIKRPENGPSSKLECRSAEHRGEEEEKAEENFSTSEAVGSMVMPNRDPSTYLEDEKDYLDIEALKRKLEETESAMTKIIARMSRIVPKTQKPKLTPEKKITEEQKKDDQKTVKILGMESTSTYEGGKKWDPNNRLATSAKSKTEELIETVTPQEIYLEGTLPHESQILVADAEERLEEEPNDGEDDGEGPAIILSSKMTLSLISLDHEDKSSSHGKQRGSCDQVAKGSAKELVETIGGAHDTLKRGM